MCSSRPVSGRGTVFTYTVNYQPFNPAVPVPYVIAIVELEEQADLRIASNIVDCEPDSVYVGLPVEVRFERQDVGDESVLHPGLRATGRRLIVDCGAFARNWAGGFKRLMQQRVVWTGLRVVRRGLRPVFSSLGFREACG